MTPGDVRENHSYSLCTALSSGMYFDQDVLTSIVRGDRRAFGSFLEVLCILFCIGNSGAVEMLVPGPGKVISSKRP